MRNIFRNFDIHQCPHCKASVIMPRFGQKAILISRCQECLELVMVLRSTTYRLDKTLVTSIDIEKLQEHILDVLDSSLPPTPRNLPLSKESGDDFFDESELVILLDDAEDIMAGDDPDRTLPHPGRPITKEEIFSFREYLKSYKMPWKGNRLY